MRRPLDSRSRCARPARRLFVAARLLVLILPTAGCDDGPNAPTGRFERVVLVTIDTLRADHLQSYGYARQTSPFLDRLAQEGVVFTRAHATMSHTAPSHASMFTGLLPLQHGVLRNGDELSPALPNAAQQFRDAGYRTGAFLSTGFLSRVATGFETVDCAMRSGNHTVDRAVDWIEAGDPARPFFAWVHLFDVHEAERPKWAPPRACYDANARRTPLGPRAFYNYLAELHGLPNPPPGEPFPTLTWDTNEKLRATSLASREELVARIDDYDAQIAFVDSQIERLFEVVANVGAPGSSLWIVTSDHGEGLGSHGYRGHGAHIYEAQLHVPLIVYASDGSLPAARVDDVVSLVDVFPTLAGTLLSGPREPLVTEGVSLWPELTGKKGAAGGRAVYAQKKPMPAIENRVYALITQEHKYIHHTVLDDEFYDLSADPGELQNRIDEPSAAVHRALLHAKLEELGSEAAQPSDEREELPADMLDELRALGYLEEAGE